MGNVGRLTKHFDISAETGIYKIWEESKSFESKSTSSKKFIIPMPPPNITGQLHMGHAIFITLQDILIRYHRMIGDDTIWIPGTDHAGIATQDKILENLKKLGISNPNKEEFLQYAAEWKKTTHSTITTQIRKLGASCDWSRERFTLDEQYSKSVQYAFKKCKDLLYHEDGQWYLNMKPLAQSILEEYYAGNITIIPEYSGKTFCHFLENIEPWCISRQIWWGHQMPICDDVFDTWFSSALWPFAILGWPDITPDFERYYPANIIETADDILFFWCARMLMMGKYLTGILPFKTIYLHGIIRDKHGRKMSKSLNNGIDPLDIISKYGCDTLRFTLAEDTMPAQDTKMKMEKIDASKKFMNKLWQASRFCLRFEFERDMNAKPIHENDLKMLEMFQDFSSRYKCCLDNYEFKQATIELRKIFKDTFCDWYIEDMKKRIDTNSYSCMMNIFEKILIYFHPFIPFITEQIWSSFHDDLLIDQQM